MSYYIRVFDVLPGSTNLSKPVEDEFELIEQAFADVEGERTVDLAAIYAAIALKAAIASPAFTGTPTAPTASLATSTTQIATTAFVQNVLGASGALLPPQSGHDGEFLKTVGGVASWAAVSSSIAWADITGKPTTIGGFGLTDAQFSIEVASGNAVKAINPRRISFTNATVSKQGDTVVVTPNFPHFLLLAQGII